MTQPPSGRPHPVGAYPPDARYRESTQPVGGYVEPRYLPPPPRASGQETLQSRNRPQRRTPIFAPLLALIGVILVAGVSYWGLSFLNAQVDEAAAAEASNAPVVGVADPDRTQEPEAAAAQEPTPEATDEVLAPLVIQAPPGEGADVKGSILFSRGGDMWAASGTQLRRLTDTKSSTTDSDPAWTDDGKDVYFIRTSQKTTDKTRPGGKYTLTPTDLMRIKADGGGGSKTVYKSLIQQGGKFWFTHVLQPSVSPNGKNVVVVSDGPDGSGPVVLYVVNSKSGKMRKVPAPTKGVLGHNDPDFSPDGGRIAYTYNDNNGTTGMPRIGIFTCQTKANCSKGKNKLMKRGFANPSWSPDGDWLAVEATSGTGRNIVVINTRNGDIKSKLTTDFNSFAPVVSPDGDQIAYLHRDGTQINLRVMTLDIDDRGNITLLSDQAVTSDGGVDGGSSPSWYVPKSQLSNPQPGADGDAATEAAGQSATASPATDASDAGEGVAPPPGS